MGGEAQIPEIAGMHNSRRNQPQLSAPCFQKKLKIGSGRVNETCQLSGIINYS
jgi:hypothetical protein